MTNSKNYGMLVMWVHKPNLPLTSTRSPATIPLINRMITSISASLLLKKARTISSNRKGADKAIENGQPNIPPTAKKKIPCAVFSPPLQFMKAAIPNIVVYIAKLDGRKEADAWNIPGLNIIDIMKKMAIRGLRMLFMTRNIWVWQRAHTKARAYRMK